MDSRYRKRENLHTESREETAIKQQRNRCTASHKSNELNDAVICITFYIQKMISFDYLIGEQQKYSNNDDGSASIYWKHTVIQKHSKRIHEYGHK